MVLLTVPMALMNLAVVRFHFINRFPINVLISKCTSFIPSHYYKQNIVLIKWWIQLPWMEFFRLSNFNCSNFIYFPPLNHFSHFYLFSLFFSFQRHRVTQVRVLRCFHWWIQDWRGWRGDDSVGWNKLTFAKPGLSRGLGYMEVSFLHQIRPWLD